MMCASGVFARFFLKSALVLLRLHTDLVLNRLRGHDSRIGPHLVDGEMLLLDVNGEIDFRVVADNLLLVLRGRLVLAPGAERVRNVDTLQVRFQVHHVSLNETDFVTADNAENVPLRVGVDELGG